MGYTPIFSGVFDGTLHGKYPDSLVWIAFLALADKNGMVDMTPEAISSRTGTPLDVLLGCISRFEQPDPRSRSGDHEGRRLVRIDPDRDWGWRIVNHSKYREKARLLAKSEREVAEGKNAERMRDRRRPPVTAADPLSNSNTNEEEESFPVGLDPEAWKEWESYRRAIKKPITKVSRLRAQQKLAGFGSRQAEVVAHSVANGWQGLFAPDDKPKEGGGAPFKFSN